MVLCHVTCCNCANKDVKIKDLEGSLTLLEAGTTCGHDLTVDTLQVYGRVSDNNNWTEIDNNIKLADVLSYFGYKYIKFTCYDKVVPEPQAPPDAFARLTPLCLFIVSVQTYLLSVLPCKISNFRLIVSVSRCTL